MFRLLLGVIPDKEIHDTLESVRRNPTQIHSIVAALYVKEGELLDNNPQTPARRTGTYVSMEQLTRIHNQLKGARECSSLE